MPLTATKINLPPRRLRAINSPIIFLAAVLFGLGSLYMAAQKHAYPPRPAVVVTTPAPTPERFAGAIPMPSPTPVLQQIVPRADPVVGPLTTGGAPMLAGSQYWLKMPDGREILVNFRGVVPHAFNLPKQRGVNNAAYLELATNHLWIWTLPATGPNIPRWIDP